MRIGKVCTYVDSKGVEHRAIILALTGTGPSLFKRLTVEYNGGVREDVAHENDAEGHVFWREGEPEEMSPVEREALPNSLPPASGAGKEVDNAATSAPPVLGGSTEGTGKGSES
jgi:hypothetical protein